ncbi:MAG TPA: hypothetical protein VNK05_12440 [Chloroflexota bacterium]|nr:hypothetical protein [Chloroflexota bacterium]
MTGEVELPGGPRDLSRLRVAPYDPITPEAWNRLREAIIGLYGAAQELAARRAADVLVTVLDQEGESPIAAAAVRAVFATAAGSGLPLPPAFRLDGTYLIAGLAPGEYEIAVEPFEASGLLPATKTVSVPERETVSLEFRLRRDLRQRTVPAVFGLTLTEAQAALRSRGLVAGRIVDAHGQAVAAAGGPAVADRRVLGSEPSQDLPVAAGASVDLLLAGALDPASGPVR